MVFGKGREKKNEEQWKWEGEVIEKVKVFTYLGFKFQRNGDTKEHTRERIRRTNILIREVWGLGERVCKDDFKKRMYLFDHLVIGSLLYGAEIFGWREHEEMERIQTKYIR